MPDDFAEVEHGVFVVKSKSVADEMYNDVAQQLDSAAAVERE